jgi:2-dehydro-3-deoxygalactonokinase
VVDEIMEPTGVKAIHANLGDHPSVDARAAAFSRFFSERIHHLTARHNLELAEVPAVISGMASSSVGWIELPYATVPFPLDGSRAAVAPVAVPSVDSTRPRCWLVSGVRTTTDIMRGEECEIMGLMELTRGTRSVLRGVVVLPGTHSKHARIENGVMTDFQTAMTGEVCEIMARHSLLRMSVAWPPGRYAPATPESEAYLEGVATARRESLLRGLFRVRTRTVLDAVDPHRNGWFLSGLLIGSEIADLVSSAGELPILLAGSPRFSALYAAAFEMFNARDRLIRLAPENVDRATVLAHATILRHILSARSGEAHVAMEGA